MEKWEPVSLVFSPCVLCPVLLQWGKECQYSCWPRPLALCFNRQWGVSPCILESGEALRKVENWHTAGKSRVKTEYWGGGWEGENQQWFNLRLWTPELSLCKCSEHIGYSSMALFLNTKQSLHPSIYQPAHSLPFFTDPFTHPFNQPRLSGSLLDTGYTEMNREKQACEQVI